MVIFGAEFYVYNSRKKEACPAFVVSTSYQLNLTLSHPNSPTFRLPALDQSHTAPFGQSHRPILRIPTWSAPSSFYSWRRACSSPRRTQSRSLPSNSTLPTSSKLRQSSELANTAWHLVGDASSASSVRRLSVPRAPSSVLIVTTCFAISA